MLGIHSGQLRHVRTCSVYLKFSINAHGPLASITMPSRAKVARISHQNTRIRVTLAKLLQTIYGNFIILIRRGRSSRIYSVVFVFFFFARAAYAIKIKAALRNH